MIPSSSALLLLLQLAPLAVSARSSSSSSSVAPSGLSGHLLKRAPSKQHNQIAKVRRAEAAASGTGSGYNFEGAVSSFFAGGGAATASAATNAAAAATTSPASANNAAATTPTTTPVQQKTTQTTTPANSPTTAAPAAATTSPTTKGAASKTTSSKETSSVVSVVVVVVTNTNSAGQLTTATSSSLTTTAPTVSAAASNSSSNTGQTWGIVGGAAGGAVVLIGVLFVAWRMSQKRFSGLDGATGADEIKWPQLQMEGQMVAVGASTLRPDNTRRTGGAGVGEDEDDFGRSTEHLDGDFQEGYVVGNEVFSGRPPPSQGGAPSVSNMSMSEHNYPTGPLPVYPPATASLNGHQQQYNNYYAQSNVSSPPPFGQHAQHQSFNRQQQDEQGDATWEFMTGQSDAGGAHNGGNLQRNNSAYSSQGGLTRAPTYASGHAQLQRSGSGYSNGGGHQPLPGANLRRADTAYSQASVYTQRGGEMTYAPGAQQQQRHYQQGW